jgi:hypothetical protein
MQVRGSFLDRLGRNSQDRDDRRRRPNSTVLVGAVTVIGMVRGAVVGGLSGALLIFALCAIVTGLYVTITGRQSWALLKGGRKMGAVVTVGALLMFLSALSVYSAHE